MLGFERQVCTYIKMASLSIVNDPDLEKKIAEWRRLDKVCLCKVTDYVCSLKLICQFLSIILRVYVVGRHERGDRELGQHKQYRRAAQQTLFQDEIRHRR